MKKIFVHIGTYKTATSTIQSILSTESMASDAQVTYLMSGRNRALNKHLRLYDATIDDSFNSTRREGIDYSVVIGNVCKEIRNSDNSIFVISEEEFSFPDESVAEKLEFLRDLGEVTILFVVRDQVEFLDSLYRQFMKEDARRITDDFDTFILDGLVRKRGMFDVIADYWAAVFGKENIKVVDFESLKETGDVVKGFMEWAGIPIDVEPARRIFNLSINAAQAEVLRRFSVAEPDFDRGPAVDYFDKEKRSLLVSAVSEAACRRIREIYSVSNRRLLDRYGVVLQSKISCDELLDPESHMRRLSEDATTACLDYCLFLQDRWRQVRALVDDK